MNSSSSRYYRSLDIWRGIACLMVIVFHATFHITEIPPARRYAFLSGTLTPIIDLMWIGVPLFFVISGYCIAASADSLRRKGERVSYYFKKRLWRIFPPFIAFLAIASVVVLALSAWEPRLFSDVPEHAIYPPTVLTLFDWIGNLTLTEGWLSRLFDRPETWFMGHAWSLQYEEQFYAVCGLALILSRRHFFKVAAIITVLVLAIAVAQYTPGMGPQGYFFDGFWLLFALGIAVYWRVNYATKQQKRIVDALLIVVVLLSSLLCHFEPGELTISLVTASIFALLLIPLHHIDIRVSNMRLLRPIGAAGRMCYSLYLIHWPITKAISNGMFILGVTSFWGTLLVTLLCIVVSVAIAWPFHLYIERRFLTLPAQWQKPAMTTEPAIASS